MRVIGYTYDLPDDIYTCNLEHRWKDQTDNMKNISLIRLTKYLGGYDDRDFFYLQGLIEDYFQFQVNPFKYVQIDVTQIPIKKEYIIKKEENSVTESQGGDDCVKEQLNKNNAVSDRVYYKQIDETTMSIIKKLPFQCFKDNYGSKTKDQFLESYAFNGAMVELMGMELFCLSEAKEGFEVMEFIKCKNWIEFYIKLLRFKMNLDGQDELVFGRDELYIQIEKSDLTIPGFFTMFKQYYLDSKRTFISEIYLVFTIG